MTSIRIDVVVEAAASAGAWPVAIQQGARVLARHAMAAVELDGVPSPAPAAGGVSAPALADTIDALRAGGAAVADVHALGDHLFAALLGPAWPAVEPALAGADLVELALHLDAAPALAGLPWELLRRADRFLAAGLDVAGVVVDVAITRRVRRPAVDHPPLVHPLRYLFAVGTELGDAVRSGAECLGLLRQIGPAVRDRIVQRQSLDHLAAEIAALDPHILHVICHGRDGARGVELEMWNDDRNAAEYVAAGELVDRVVRIQGQVRRAPTVVILSACSSGQRLATAGATDLATALVARGVPVVVGMAAEIRDLACRLFTRRLGAAVVERTPLLAAAVAGRRAALRSPQLPDDAFDWGLIQMVIGDDIDATIAVRACLPDSDEEKVMGWLAAASLPIDLDPARQVHPPLCGATDVLDGLHRLMLAPSPGRINPLAGLFLLAHPPREGARVGKRRAFAEVAAAAIRAGHLPVIVLPSRGKGYPRTRGDLLERLHEAFIEARSRRGLPPRDHEIGKLAADGSGLKLRQALEADARALTTDARAAHDFVARSQGEALIMLHDVHRYHDGLFLALELLGSTGAGVGGRVPVVMSWARNQSDPTVRASAEERLAERLRDGATWIAKVDLMPLSGVHANLAFQRVLLHPFEAPGRELKPDYALRRWFLDLAARDHDALTRALRRLYKGSERGCAGMFVEDRFIDDVEEALAEPAAVRPAEDDDVLRGGGP